MHGRLLLGYTGVEDLRICAGALPPAHCTPSFLMSLPGSVPSLVPQFEETYEDEYDDSFDELINHGAEGVTEIEGVGPVAAAQRAMDGLSLGLEQQHPQHRERQAAAQGPAGGRGRGRGPLKAGRLWVQDGRIYNYPKPGAVEVGSQQEAQQALAVAQAAAQEIYGLGPGGNVPLPAQPPPQQQREAQQIQDGAGDGTGGTTASGRSAAGSSAGGGSGAGPGSAGGRRRPWRWREGWAGPQPIHRSAKGCICEPPLEGQSCLVLVRSAVAVF